MHDEYFGLREAFYNGFTTDGAAAVRALKRTMLMPMTYAAMLKVVGYPQPVPTQERDDA